MGGSLATSLNNKHLAESIQLDRFTKMNHFAETPQPLDARGNLVAPQPDSDDKATGAEEKPAVKIED